MTKWGFTTIHLKQNAKTWPRCSSANESPKKQKLSLLHAKSWPLSFGTAKEFFSSGIFLKAWWLMQMPTMMFSNRFDAEFLENIRVVSKILSMCSSLMTTRTLTQPTICKPFFRPLVGQSAIICVLSEPRSEWLLPVPGPEDQLWGMEIWERWRARIGNQSLFQQSSRQLLLRRLMSLTISLQVFRLKWWLYRKVVNLKNKRPLNF